MTEASATQWIDARTIATSFHVRFAETDLMGIVHHANYPIWFEEARSAFMRAMGTSYALFEAEGISLAVSALDLRFLSPARYDRLVTIQCRLEKVQSRKLRFSYTVLDAETETTLAIGMTEHICIDAAGHAIRIPPVWYERFARIQ